MEKKIQHPPFDLCFQFREKCSRIVSTIRSSRMSRRTSIPTLTRMTCTTKTSSTGSQRPSHRHRSCTGNCQSRCPESPSFRQSSQRWAVLIHRKERVRETITWKVCAKYIWRLWCAASSWIVIFGAKKKVDIHVFPVSLVVALRVIKSFICNPPFPAPMLLSTEY